MRFEPLKLSRALGDVAPKVLAWRRGLTQVRGFEKDPFAADRWATGLSCFQQVSELPDDDPLRASLLRWVFALAEERINRETLLARQWQLRGQTWEVSSPTRGLWSVGAMRFRMLAESQLRSAWVESLWENSEAISETVIHLWQRRAEIARRLGLDRFDDLIEPAPSPQEWATAWLRESDDLRRDAAEGVGDFSSWISAALGLPEGAARKRTGAPDVFPPRVSETWLSDPFRATDLTKSLRIDPGEFCHGVGPASFARGLARFGAAWAEAAAPKDQPFVIAHDPFGLQTSTFGALFAGLLANAEFAKRALGLGSSKTKELLRAMSVIFLMESRAVALRVLLRQPALESESEFRDAFEALVETHLGVSVPAHALGVTWSLRRDDAQRLAAMGLAAVRHNELRDAHNEDWFRNPRAIEELRADVAKPPQTNCHAAEITRGFAALKADLEAALSS